VAIRSFQIDDKNAGIRLEKWTVVEILVACQHVLRKLVAVGVLAEIVRRS